MERGENIGDRTKSREWQGRGHNADRVWGGGKDEDEKGWRVWSVGRRGRREDDEKVRITGDDGGRGWWWLLVREKG